MKDFFEFSKHQTNLKTEILAGLTTFMATAYIIVVNPAILAKSGLPYNGVLTATVLVSFITSLAMGLYAKNPIVLAPGMGLNAFFTFSVVLGMGVTPQVALGAVTWSGVIFFIMSVFKLRQLLIKAIPTNLRLAIACGIGLFIALIGLVNAKIVVDHPVTLIQYAKFNSQSAIFFIGLFLTAVLVIRKVAGALLLGIIITGVMSLVVSPVKVESFIAAPDFSLIGQLDLKGSLGLGFIHVMFSLVFTDLFDSISTFVAVSEAGNLKDENGDPRNIKKSLLVDAFGTTVSGILGTSPATSYIESAAGIEQGGRTGLVAIIAGLLFLPFLFLSPALSLLPSVATAPTLVIVGFLMTTAIKKMNFDDFSEGFPAFIAMIFIPLTYSIGQGIVWGFLSYTFIKVCTGKTKDLNPGLIIINVLCLVSLFV